MVETTTEINQLLKEVQTITQSYDRVAEATGENFNVFSIMQMEHYEVKTHSRFIAELLNPKGRHGQKDTFLKLFISAIINNKPSDTTGKAQGSSTKTTPFSFESATAEVIVEHYVGPVTNETGGRIDILIREKGHKGKVIMIENKIYAEEQPDQLLRYYNAYPNGELLFLTLDGKESEKESSIGVKYTRVCYAEKIVLWLELCKKECTSITILRETIAQYINLIKKLTNQNLNKQMSQDIAKRVLIDVESFRAFRALARSQNEIANEVIIKRIIPAFKAINDDDEFKSYDLKLSYTSELLKNQNPLAGFTFKNNKLDSLNLSIVFRFDGKNLTNLIYGLCYNDRGITNNYINHYEIIKNKAKDGFLINSDWWICYNYYVEPYKNWSNLDNLEKIYFEFNFDEDLKNKIRTLLEVIAD